MRVEHAIGLHGNEDITSFRRRVLFSNGDPTEEMAPWPRDSNEHECQRDANTGIDPVLDGGEDSYQNLGEPDEELERGHSPVRIDLRWFCH